MSTPNRLGAKDAARRIERGELTARALVDACLERIAERERDVMAWAFVDPGLARANAAQARGPLFGLPIGVKDVFDTFDMPTEYGSAAYPGHRPRTDSAAAALARRAGGTILGKTVTCEFATMVPSRTRNPLDLARTPGGSSSGSAAAVADFMVPLAFGTQTAGSTIRPGSYNGIVSYKPTFNLIACSGLKPSADSLDTVGLFARSVEDVAFFGRHLTGIEALESVAHAPRVAMCRMHEWDRMKPEACAVFEDAARVLGATELRLPDAFKPLREAHSTIIRFEGARSFADDYARHAGKMDPALRERVREGFSIPAEEYLRARRLAAECAARFADVLGSYDAIIAPAATAEAPLGHSSTGDTSMNVVWTLLHVPCVGVPAGSGPAGLPIGIQVVGRHTEDARTLACARWVESKLREKR